MSSGWKIDFSPRALKSLANLDRSAADRIAKKLERYILRPATRVCLARR